MLKLMLFATALVCLPLVVVRAFPEDDILEACESLVLPSNGTEAEDGMLQYRIDFTATGNNTWLIRLRGIKPFVTLTGFILQARPATNWSQYETFGNFVPDDDDAVEAISCQKEDDTATHTTEVINIRNAFEFVWVPPVNQTGTIVFA